MEGQNEISSNKNVEIIKKEDNNKKESKYDKEKYLRYRKPTMKQQIIKLSNNLDNANKEIEELKQKNEELMKDYHQLLKENRMVINDYRELAKNLKSDKKIDYF